MSKQDVRKTVGANTMCALELGLTQQSGTPRVLTNVTLQLTAAACMECDCASRPKWILAVFLGHLDGCH